MRRTAAEGRTPQVGITDAGFGPHLPAESPGPRVGIANERRHFLQGNSGRESGGKSGGARTVDVAGPALGADRRQDSLGAVEAEGRFRAGVEGEKEVGQGLVGDA